MLANIGIFRNGFFILSIILFALTLSGCEESEESAQPPAIVEKVNNQKEIGLSIGECVDKYITLSLELSGGESGCATLRLMAITSQEIRFDLDRTNYRKIGAASRSTFSVEEGDTLAIAFSIDNRGSISQQLVLTLRVKKSWLETKARASLEITKMLRRRP